MKKTKKLDYTEYKKRLDNYLNSNKPIRDSKKNILVLESDEKFYQCYDPHVPGRRELTKYWFVSNKGNVISVASPTPRWLFGWRNAYGKELYRNPLSYRWVFSHILVALCIPGDLSNFPPNAKTLLEEKGLAAFGTGSNDLCIHHIDGFDANRGRAYNNDPETLLPLIGEVHHIFDCIPNLDANERQQKAFAKKVIRLIQSGQLKMPLISQNRVGSPRNGNLVDLEFSSTSEKSQPVFCYYSITSDPDCSKDYEKRKKNIGNTALSIYNLSNGQYRVFSINRASTQTGKSYCIQLCVLGYNTTSAAYEVLGGNIWQYQEQNYTATSKEATDAETATQTADSTAS